MHKAQRLINHVALVLDGSSSMSGHTNNLIKVADEQIRYLALRSEELQQETRVSVYLFNDAVECLIFDMDVMRLPSIADLYRASGMTALVDAVIKSQQDLNSTSQIYGDHAFLTFVLTDGAENRSKNPWTQLSRTLSGAADNWTVGFLVPDRQGVAYMERIGASKGSIAIWDAQSAKGLTDAVSTIRSATDTFMTNRAKGIRGTSGVFSMGADAVNTKTVKQNLEALDRNLYTTIQNGAAVNRIDDLVTTKTGRYYVKGKSYYQLVKRETIQATKEIVVVDKSNGQAYTGRNARALLGLPDEAVKVSPEANPKYDIYVQSTSINRKVMPNQKVLVRS